MTDDLRDRLAASASEWALLYPLANWPWVGRWAGGDALRTMAETIATRWGDDLADRMLAVVQPELERLRGEIDRLADYGIGHRERAEKAEAALESIISGPQETRDPADSPSRAERDELRRLLTRASTHLRSLCTAGRHDNWGADLACAACVLSGEIDVGCSPHE